MNNISNDLLDKFYDLADFDRNKRHNAVITLLKEFKLQEWYFVERLISGLSSSRAAARIGYTNALAVILSTVGKDWTPKSLFTLAEQKLPMDETENPGSFLGHHFLHFAMVCSDIYEKALCDIVKREMYLMDKGLAYAAADLLALCGNKLQARKFAKDFWPLVKENVVKPLDLLAPEWFYFVLMVVEKHASTLKSEISFVTENGELCFDSQNFTTVTNILKKADSFGGVELVLKLLLSSRKSNNFRTVYREIVEKWLFHGDQHKVISRVLPFINILLQKLDPEPTELLAVFSPEFVRFIRSLRKSAEYFVIYSTVEAVMMALKKSLISKEWEADCAAELLNNFDHVGDGNFDEFVGRSLKITDKILLRVPDKVQDLMSEALKEGGWKLRRIANVFPHWPSNAQGDVLKQFCKNNNWTVETRNAFCCCVASLFDVNLKIGISVGVHYKEEYENILKKFIRKNGIELKLPVTNDRMLTVFINVLAIWVITASNPDERLAYVRDLEELSTISGKISDNESSNSISVLIDLLLSLLSRSRRHHQSVAHYVFISFIPQMNLENLLHILEVSTINLSDEELIRDKEDSDSVDEEISDEDEYNKHEESDGENTSKINTVNDDDSETDEEINGSGLDENMEGSEVSEEFIDNLKAALGPAAADSGDDDRSSLSSTVSDDTMFRLDEGLAAVFRKRMKNSRALSTALVEQARQLRARCFDLLLIAVSSEAATFKAAELILPLIKSAQHALRRKDGEMVFRKATNLLKVIVKYRKNQLNEDMAIEMLDELVSVTSQVINPVMKDLIGDAVSFLFSACYNAKENIVSKNMREKIFDLFEKYITKNHHVMNDIVTTPIIKYPQAYFSELPRIIDFAFDENIRAFQRTEALSCALAFLRKDLAKTEKTEERKIWKRVTKCLCVFAQKYFSEFSLDNAKPRFFAYLVRILTSFASLAEKSNKMALREALVDGLQNLCDNSESWNTSNKLKSLNCASKSICGRNSLASLKHLLSILDH
ncbi:unnamed protein product [Thelazia callipaeda]|uniref:Myb-binding protein 1A-like protein n=1 Tax=Thelazia callipaeda TaxID=103827 RepID=A0A0N5CLY7_THECL|nr:unnamed protein product [Thelazia callipaeda]